MVAVAAYLPANRLERRSSVGLGRAQHGGPQVLPCGFGVSVPLRAEARLENGNSGSYSRADILSVSASCGSRQDEDNFGLHTSLRQNQCYELTRSSFVRERGVFVRHR